MITQMMGSRNPRIEIRTSLDGIIMTPQQIAEADRKRKPTTVPPAPFVPPQGNTQPDVTKDDNPPVSTPTKGWLYVPSIGMEFAPELEAYSSNWNNAHKIAKSKNAIMPSPSETWELFFFAKAQLTKPEFRKVYEFFTNKTPTNTWHGEWQDAFFKEENGKMYMHRLKGFNLKGEAEFEKGVDITGTYQTTDGYVDISKKANITAQGLCNIPDSRTSYVKGENMYSWYPRSGYVAGFRADSVGASLYCNGGASSTSSALGVRFARRIAPSVSLKK